MGGDPSGHGVPIVLDGVTPSGETVTLVTGQSGTGGRVEMAGCEGESKCHRLTLNKISTGG